jgi:hypothetical protein
MNDQPELNAKQACDLIIDFFPEYQGIMYKVFTTSRNMSNEINEIKKTIFNNILITFHDELMEYITYIINTIQKKYTSKYFLAIPDFIDLVYQNAFYDIFTTKFQELEIISPEKIKESHLKIFNLMVYVEHVKYKLYEQFENNAPKTNIAILNTIKKRKNNCILRINVCDNLLENHPRITYKEFDYKKIIEHYKIYTKNPDLTDKFFKEIN